MPRVAAVALNSLSLFHSWKGESGLNPLNNNRPNIMTKQPEYKLIAQLGDKHPIDHGGYFIYEDTTGVYDPQAELLIAPDDDNGQWEVRRFDLPRCALTWECLSDNKFHPEHPAWFAKLEAERERRPQDTTYLSNVASFAGIELDELRAMFCSDNILDRAQAYRLVGDYHGFDNLDAYPLYFNRAEAEARYANEVVS